MSYEIKYLDGRGRVIEKHLSREFDQFFIEQGVASEQKIAIKNDFFAALNLSRFRISSIGRRPLHAIE